jgi:putative MFS transporter
MIDKMPLTRSYWITFTLSIALTVLDYFDFYVVGFLVAVLGPKWRLTFGESAVMLLSAGAGSILGALLWGDFSDRHGRRPAVFWGTLVCGVSAALVALIPDDAWWMFATLRFFVGIGLAGAATPVMALIVEQTPSRWRTFLSGVLVISATAGVLVASLSVSGLLAALGWRWIAAAGVLPALFGLLLLVMAPESARWLMAKGRPREAAASFARLSGLTEAELPSLSELRSTSSGIPPWSDLFGHPGRLWLTLLLWAGTLTANYGVYLWGPTLLSLMLGYSAPQAARIFVFVSLSGIVGKLGFSLLPMIIGRRHANSFGCLGVAAVLAAAAVFKDTSIMGLPALVVLLVAGAVFFDGIVSNVAPYTVEIYPTALAARGYGIGQAGNGVGKIAGPLVLAIIAGTSNFVSPKATVDAAGPAFLFLASCALVSFLASVLIPIDPLQEANKLPRPGSDPAPKGSSAA